MVIVPVRYRGGRTAGNALGRPNSFRAPHLAVTRWQHLFVLIILGWSIITIVMAEILKPINNSLSAPTDLLTFMLKPP